MQQGNGRCATSDVAANMAVHAAARVARVVVSSTMASAEVTRAVATDAAAMNEAASSTAMASAAVASAATAHVPASLAVIPKTVAKAGMPTAGVATVS
jgi:hypothetical protein